MLKSKRIVLTALVMFLGAAGIARADQDKTDVVERLQSAAQVLHELDNAPDKGIPDQVFKSAKCVGVVPSMIKGAFIFGGKHGRGVATCKLPDGAGALRRSSRSQAAAGDCSSASRTCSS